MLPTRDAPGKHAIEEALRRGVLREVETRWTTPKFAWLDRGEESTIRAAVNLSRLGDRCLVLIDDKDGRQVLRTIGSENLDFAGTAAVVGRAKQLGLIKSAASEFEKLRRLGFRIDDEVVRAILHDVGENLEPWPPVRRRTAARKGRH
jgi:predicted nucleic acid-binding protein